MFEVICATIFRTEHYVNWCESVLRELAEQRYGIRMPRGTARAKRYVVYKLAEYDILVKKKPRLSDTLVWVLNETWFNKVRSELDALAHVEKKAGKLTLYGRRMGKRWGRWDAKPG